MADQGIIIRILPMMKAAAATGTAATGVRYQAGWGSAIGCAPFSCMVATGACADATVSPIEARLGASSKTAGLIWVICVMHQQSNETVLGCESEITRDKKFTASKRMSGKAAPACVNVRASRGSTRRPKDVGGVR